MKRFLMIMILAVTVLLAGAQDEMISHEVFGAKVAYEVTLSSDTVEFTPKYSTTAYIVPIDTNVVINTDVGKAVAGNVVYFDISADATKRYVVFGLGFHAVNDSISANKSRTFGYLYIRDKYVLVTRTSEY